MSAAFLDPAVTTATPGWLWASTGIRAVDHAIETVCSRISFPFSDGLALEALRLLQQHLPRSASNRDDLESSGYCQLAAWMSIYNLTNVQVGLSHGLGHQLGARNDVPHGVTSCIMLPRVMEFNRSMTAPQQRRIAEAMGVDTRNADDDEAAAAAVSALENLIDTLGIPRRLSDWGVSEADLALIAQDALEDLVVATNPRPIATQEEVVELLHRALQASCQGHRNRIGGQRRLKVLLGPFAPCIRGNGLNAQTRGPSRGTCRTERDRFGGRSGQEAGPRCFRYANSHTAF